MPVEILVAVLVYRLFTGASVNPFLFDRAQIQVRRQMLAETLGATLRYNH